MEFGNCRVGTVEAICCRLIRQHETLQGPPPPLPVVGDDTNVERERQDGFACGVEDVGSECVNIFPCMRAMAILKKRSDV